MIFIFLALLSGLPHNLILIAHPDDEVMFFTPILQHLKNDCHIICLSKGNFENKGETRTEEIAKVCQIYGCMLTLLDIFEDNADWNTRNIKTIIEFYNLLYNYETIYTFDQHGVSGHKNHISCHNAMKQLAGDVKAKVYFLESKNMFRKYVYDYGMNNGILYRANGFLSGVKVMLVYKSQLKWYRYLFMLFSTYFRNVYVTD